jgi:hypothetical protein
MFVRIQQYELLEVGRRWYRPRAYGDPQLDGTWDGWLVFFPLAGGAAIAPPGPETTQATIAALAVWAAGLTPVYLEGALSRALRLEHQAPLVERLSDAEYEALDDAERLETAAEVERTAADLDDAAAIAARADADRIRRERLAAEGALAATQEAAARVEANMHEQAARDARAIAGDAKRRQRSARAQATSRKQTTRRGAKKKRSK